MASGLVWALSTETPNFCTGDGSWGMAWASRMYVSTLSTLGSVPTSKSTRRFMVPSFTLYERM